MGSTIAESIFFVKIPKDGQLCHAVVQVTQKRYIFHQQVLQCRRLLCLSTHVLAAPNLDDKTHIDVVMQVSYYKKTFAGLCQKLGLRPLRAGIAHQAIIEYCFAYTMKFRLNPLWIQAGQNMINNPNFLTCHGKMRAANVEVRVKEGEMTVHIRPRMVRLPPPCLESFGIFDNAIEKFAGEAEFCITERFINLSWCHILPTLKRGQVVRISRQMQNDNNKDTPFKDYEGMRKYWKNQMKSILFCRQYGYLLPVDKSDVIYCSVRFSFISDHLFTYPMICLRSRHAQILPRCDGASIVRSFITALHQKMDKICGLPLTYSRQPCRFTPSLTSSLHIRLKQSFPLNAQIDRSMDISESEEPQTVPGCNHQIVAGKHKATSDHIVPCRTDVIHSSQITGKTQMRRSVAVAVDAPSSVTRETLLLRFPKTAQGKYVPVFGKRAATPTHSPSTESDAGGFPPKKRLKTNLTKTTNKHVTGSPIPRGKALSKLSSTDAGESCSKSSMTENEVSSIAKPVVRKPLKKLGVSARKAMKCMTTAAKQQADAAKSSEPDPVQSKPKTVKGRRAFEVCPTKMCVPGSSGIVLARSNRSDTCSASSCSGAPAIDRPGSGKQNRRALGGAVTKNSPKPAPSTTPSLRLPPVGFSSATTHLSDTSRLPTSGSAKVFDLIFSKASVQAPVQCFDASATSSDENIPGERQRGSARKFDQLFTSAKSAVTMK